MHVGRSRCSEYLQYLLFSHWDGAAQVKDGATSVFFRLAVHAWLLKIGSGLEYTTHDIQ